MDGTTKDLQLKEILLSKNWLSDSLCSEISNYYPKSDMVINHNSNEITMNKISFEKNCALMFPLHREFVNYKQLQATMKRFCSH